MGRKRKVFDENIHVSGFCAKQEFPLSRMLEGWREKKYFATILWQSTSNKGKKKEKKFHL